MSYLPAIFNYIGPVCGLLWGGADCVAGAWLRGLCWPDF